MIEPPRLEARRLIKRFGDFTAVNGVDLTVGAGEIIGLLGPSGSGKSTFLRCMAQLETPDYGSVLIDGLPLGKDISLTGELLPTTQKTVNRLGSRIGFVFQSLNLWPHLTALENVTKGPITVQKVAKQEAIDRATALITSFGLGNKLHRRPDDLSGGERQRIAICRALVMEPAALLFDEPTSALDPELVGEVASLLRNLKPIRIAMVVTTHDMRFARAVADHLVFLERGSIVETGLPAEILANPRTERFREFINSMT